MVGSVSSFPYIENGQDMNVTIQVFYVKPTIDSCKIKSAEYPISIKDYDLLHNDSKSTLGV